jgi:phage terminase large subunit-like protein
MIADGTLQEVQDYVDQVLAGEIAVSKAVRGAVQRHVNDLAKQSTQQFPYHFDAEYAAKCIRFYPAILRHSIGRYAGLPFELSPWQKFCTGSIFGWKRDCDRTRRFRKAYRTMARKNGKSSWAAGESIFLAGFDVNPNTGKPESVSQVVLSATKREQAAKVVLAECVRMRERSAKVSSKSRYVNKEIRFEGNDSEILAIGSDKPYDGLNPHCVIMDELHAWREHHRPFHDTMITGSASRDQPLISYITTAGDDRSHLWKEVYDYAKGVATGTIDDQEYFAFIAELDEDDDPFDEANWIKANPNLGVSVSVDYLRQQAREHKTTALGVNRFTRYHGNRLVSSTEKAFDLEQWDACQGQLSDWTDADVCAGVDLGGRDDLAAYALVARFPLEERDGKPVYRYEVKVRAYIAHDTTRDIKKHPFAEWCHQDLIKVCRFPTADLRGELVEDCTALGVSMVAYDPYNAQPLADDLTKEGLTAVRMAQNCAMFNEPIREFIEALRGKRITHDGNPLLRWCMNNAVLIRDRQDRWMFDKRDSSDKIDPVVAMVMAFRMVTLAPERARGSLFVR